MSKKSSNPFLAITAGCIAGGIEATAVWPMEFIKTKLQSSPPPPYTTMTGGFSYTIRTSGFFSLYSGLAPTLLGSIPKAGIRFGLNAFLKDKLRDKETGQLTAGKNFVAGLGAGVSEALIIVTPVETVKTKCIQMQTDFLPALKHILKTEGMGGVYQGAFATALKQGSNQGLRFMWFNEFKTWVTNDGEKPMTPILGLLGGMSAGCFSTLGNNPFDVVKTRMQGTNAAAQYTSTLDCVRQTMAEGGIRAFYAGVVPRLCRVVPGQGIIFMSFEAIQNALQSTFTVFREKR